MNPDEFDSVTESVSCMSKEVPGERATAIAIDQNICDDCGKVRLFIRVQDAEGNTIVASFDENLAAYWGMLLLEAAKGIHELNKALGRGFSMN